MTTIEVLCIAVFVPVCTVMLIYILILLDRVHKARTESKYKDTHIGIWQDDYDALIKKYDKAVLDNDILEVQVEMLSEELKDRDGK